MWLLLAMLCFAMPADEVNFELANSSAEDWEFKDNCWKFVDESKTLSQHKKQSDYKPPHRSPRHIALLKKHSVSDFELTLEIKSTHKDYPHRDACLFFGYQDPGKFYYVHFGKEMDPRANQIFIVNGADRTKISLTTTDGTPWSDNWHKVKLTRNSKTGDIAVYFDEMKKPAMTAKDKTFTWGQIGVGSFDDTADFRKLKLVGKPKSMKREKQVPEKPTAPVAPKKLEKLEKHGHVRVDPYYWLRERENPEVIEYLTVENEYMEARMAPTVELQRKLTEETKARIKQTDTSVPYDLRGFTYYRRTEDGKQYPIYCRKVAGKSDAKEEIILDVNQVADGHEFCNVGGLSVSPNNDLLAYAVDTIGRRKYKIVVKDLTTGEVLPTTVPDVTGNMQWAEDSQTIFYTRQDPKTLRWYQVYRINIGDRNSQGTLVYEEKNEEFSCYVFKSRSDKYILIEAEQTLSSEVLLIDAENPESKPVVFHPRETDHEYSVDHLGDAFYIRTNWDAKNFRLMSTGSVAVKQSWKEIIPHDDNVFFDGFELFDEFMVVQQKTNALPRLRIRSMKDGTQHDLDFGMECFDAESAFTPEPGTTKMRYNFSSMKTPDSVFEYDMQSREKKLLKQDEVLGGFDEDNYETKRLWATARDGVKVPVSVLYRKSTAIDGTAPCLLYAYGSYGSSMEAAFRSSRYNLIDRGFVYAIAHVRGGQELGRDWYENGKLLKKKNTFTDFIDVGRHLVDKGYASKDKLYARGGSAGGLLMGAVANMAPDLFHGIIADVPFVDVITTMLDDTIPLTTSEYDEWGNPNVKEYYDYMLSYSPYDQVRKQAYPNMLVYTGLHDSQVQYWEPAKWVARLRDMKTDDNMLVMKTNMDAGHGGASGRYKRYQEIAFRDAFVLWLAGIRE